MTEKHIEILRENLSDSKLNIVVSCFLADSKSTKIIYDFLNELKCNQKIKCITTDLKLEYKDIIDKSNFNQEFCLFYSK